jgi:hypothetical protein
MLLQNIPAQQHQHQNEVACSRHVCCKAHVLKVVERCRTKGATSQTVSACPGLLSVRFGPRAKLALPDAPRQGFDDDLLLAGCSDVEHVLALLVGAAQQLQGVHVAVLGCKQQAPDQLWVEATASE